MHGHRNRIHMLPSLHGVIKQMSSPTTKNPSFDKQISRFDRKRLSRLARQQEQSDCGEHHQNDYAYNVRSYEIHHRFIGFCHRRFTIH